MRVRLERTIKELSLLVDGQNVDEYSAKVEIEYVVDEGDRGDYWTPPTGPTAELIKWKILRMYDAHEKFAFLKL